MQSTNSGFGLVNAENTFRVCDQPHPLVVANIIQSCQKGQLEEAYENMKAKQRVIAVEPSLSETQKRHEVFWVWVSVSLLLVAYHAAALLPQLTSAVSGIALHILRCSTILALTPTLHAFADAIQNLKSVVLTGGGVLLLAQKQQQFQATCAPGSKGSIMEHEVSG
eukprot:scaffold149278_cov21-Tisochrysis_lutea.AAC.1